MAFTITQNDTSPSIKATLKDGAGTVIDLTSATCKIHVMPLGGTVLKVNAITTITNPTTGIVQYDWIPADTTDFGTFSIQFEVTYGNGTIETFPNNGSLAMIITKELG
jgi:hypothetical protein|tara:strand:- start:1146 stop:1469 length:324 start_codon:yes stop_codon:yes gene_type:complete